MNVRSTTRNRLAIAIVSMMGLTGASAGAMTIGFEPGEGYSAGSLSGKPSSGTKWSGTSNLMYVTAGVGNPGQAARFAAPNSGPTAFSNVQFAPAAADFGGDAAPITAGYGGKLSFGMDLAVNTASDLSSSTALSAFLRFGSDDVEFFLQRDGELEIRSSAGNFLAATTTGGATAFDFDTYGLNTFVRVEGVANYATDTFTVWVNGVQQSHATAGLNIPFKNGVQPTNAFDHVRFQNNFASTDVAYRQFTVDNLNISVVPEPAFASLLAGLTLLGVGRRQR